MAPGKKRGIFCLECDWWNNLKKPSSVEPVLHLLHQWETYRVPYIHRDVDTLGSLEHYLRKWVTKSYSDYPILYLGFHGDEGIIYIGDKRRAGGKLTLEQLGEKLEGKCRGRIIYFCTCATMGIHYRRLDKFVAQTGALAVCGYTKSVEWLISSGFELFVLAAIQQNTLTANGAKAMKKRIQKEAGQLAKRLGFRMVIRKPKTKRTAD